MAEANGEAHAVNQRIRWLRSDLLAGVRGEAFDVVVSNPPYVPEGEALAAEVLDFEPHGALFAGPDGLDLYRRLIPGAAEALPVGGLLALEIGHGQSERVCELLRPWRSVEVMADLRGIPRVVVAHR